MAGKSLPSDPLWPRAGHWLAAFSDAEPGGDLALIGVPAHMTSITPTNAHLTPGAIREALMRYSTYASGAGVDVGALRAVDLGDVPDPDGPAGEERVEARVRALRERFELVVALGGDNSITYPVVRGLFGDDLADCGLVTVDAHHDLRDGISNGSPVRRLLEAGLPGRNVVQIGIGDFSNSAGYAARAREAGITVIPRAALRGADLSRIAIEALCIAGGDARRVFVDIDADVCDRAAVPGCPSAAPGGISADELRQLVGLLARDRRVKGMDVTEIDAGTDSIDGRTVRLGALLVLEAAAGLATRRPA